MLKITLKLLSNTLPVIYAVIFVIVSLLNDGTAVAGELFYLSADKGMTADKALGQAEPVSQNNIEILDDGAQGKAFRCPDFSYNLAYEAPGNIYAERGTIAFYFRARYDWGTTPFKLFQASHGDHSSFDMSFLRIDYNGKGFDAFVTDVNLARVRVSYMPEQLPAPDEWTHFALAWDENTGVRFYVNGKQVAAKDSVTVLYAALGKFGPHGYMVNDLSIGPGGPDIRGGDFDELRIIDTMLDDSQIVRLAEGANIAAESPSSRTLSDSAVAREWRFRYGWNRPNDTPPRLSAGTTTIRQLGISDAYDLKQWMYKGCDGIRETTWPNVYNRSRLPGRLDYFVLPDWNCYSLSGKAVTFTLPDEPWNYVEITGAAYGNAERVCYNNESSAPQTTPLFRRPEHQERTFHLDKTAYVGGKLRFTNDIPEMAIGELNVFNITNEREPLGTARLTYTIRPDAEPVLSSLATLNRYIDGRYLPDERTTVVALPAGAPSQKRKTPSSGGLPLVHVLIPFEFRTTVNGSVGRYSYTWENLDGGLDGILLELPAFDVDATDSGLLPMNVQIKDPIWPDRNLMDVSFSVAPGEARRVWLDTRDRMLPNGYSLYMTFAAAGGGFDASSLSGAKITLVFEETKAAKTEHVADRFTQIRDNYGNLIEAGPNNKVLGFYRRFSEDITDLFRVAPQHIPGRYYWSYNNPEQGWPAFEQPKTTDDTPLWAFRQIKYLEAVSDIILWWIDNRQIENGELGGGLSDDSDYTNVWPIPALNGVEPEKITDSLSRMLDAIYDNGMITNGINTITADGLHTTEEGNNVQGQLMLLKYGDPKLMERMMETVRGLETVTGINAAGHRHFRSGYFGSHYIATEGPWAYSMFQTSRILHPAMYVAEFSGNPKAKTLILELADGLFAHRRQENGNWITPANVNFLTDEDRGNGFGNYNHVLWGAWCWTRDNKYLQPLIDNGPDYMSGINGNVIDILGKRDTWGKDITKSVTPRSGSTYARHLAWQYTGDKRFLEEYYADEIQHYTQRNYLFTEGHFWTDRVSISAAELQRSRLGGVAKRGKGNIYPGQTVSWKFVAPSTWRDLAILVPYSTEREFKIVAYNLSDTPVTAEMTGWMVDPGMWEVVQGIDSNDDDEIDGASDKRTVYFERTQAMTLTFPSRKTSVLTFKLKNKGEPYWKRHDLGIGPEDVHVEGRNVRVTVHSLGAVPSPKSTLKIVSANGADIATQEIPQLEAPLDCIPRTVDISVVVPSGTNLAGSTVTIVPPENDREITMINNTAIIGK